MKRSELNAIQKDAVEFINGFNFKMPPFVTWTYDEWKNKTHEYDEIRENYLGWDITDFGYGDYNKVGLLMITLRNGNFKDVEGTKPYAEKLMICYDQQVTPYHYHYKKVEDIINRGGGDLVIKVYNKTEDDKLADTDVIVYQDGRKYSVPAGYEVKLAPGESISMPAGTYHSFWPINGKTLVGEVSRCNDDTVDNHFLEEKGRFPAIEEDAPILYPLFSEYPEFI